MKILSSIARELSSYKERIYIPALLLLSGESMAKVLINKDLCISCGVCWALTPDIFEMDPATGKTRIKQPYLTKDNDNLSEGVIPDSMIDTAKNAASSCPTNAISIE